MVKKSGMESALLTVLADAPAGEVTLPGFTLFSRGTRSPYEWCVPKVLDEARLLNTYEEYADRRLGYVRAPERVARRLIRQPQSANNYFGPSPRHSTHWRVPALKLLAMAQHFGSVVEVKDTTYTTELCGYLMQVTTRGCYSNLHRKIVPAVMPGDLGNTEIVVPPLRTAHPLATSLVLLGFDEAALWAANTAIRAESRHLVDTEGFLEDHPHSARSRARARKMATLEERMAAALEATEIIEGMQYGVLTALYDAIVPTLCNAQRFKKLFGNPWVAPNIKPKPETRRQWVSRIEMLSAEVSIDT